jgi:hypothetical protein
MNKKIILFAFSLLIGIIFSFTLFWSYKPAGSLVKESDLPYYPKSNYSIKVAPSSSLKGSIDVLADNVYLTERIASEAAKISGNVEITQGEDIETDTSGQASLIFAKEAEIEINPDSKISIIQTLPNDMVFNQTKGNIIYKNIGEYPLSVRCKHILISNTNKFSVEIDKEKPLITVIGIEGDLTVAYNSTSYITKTLKVSEGQKLIFNDSTRKAVLK